MACKVERQVNDLSPPICISLTYIKKKEKKKLSNKTVELEEYEYHRPVYLLYLKHTAHDPNR
jgi:hypothetical protein